MVHKNGIVHLKDIKKYERVYIKLKEKDKRVQLYKIRNIPKNIIWVGTRTGNGIKNPKFPFNFNNREGFILISSILGDGSLHKNLEVSYSNYERVLVNKFEECIKKVFGSVEKINIKKVKKSYNITLPTILGIIMKEVGLKEGRKTLTNPGIPQFILEGKDIFKKDFLRQFSDDEASLQINIPYSYSIRYELAIKRKRNKKKIPSNLLLNLKKLVNEMGYKTSKIYSTIEYKCKDKSILGNSWAFSLQGKDSLEKFSREVGFSIIKKQKRLVEGLKVMKRVQLGSERMYKTALDNFIIIYEKNGFVTKHSLANQASISIRNSIAWLSKLNEKGLIKIKNRHRYIHDGNNICGLKGRTPNEYVLNNKKNYPSK